MMDRVPDPPPLFAEAPADDSSRAAYRADLLEQYKLYVDMADRVSERRLTANSHFVTVNAALLGFVGYLTTQQDRAWLWLIGLAGIALSLLWFRTLRSYRDLSAAKFAIIHQVERRLPLNLYDVEWALMGRGARPDKYRPLSTLEQGVPWAFVGLHACVVALSVSG